MPFCVRLKGQTSTASRLSAERNWSGGGGMAGGDMRNRREDARGKGARVAGGSKGEKRGEDHRGRGGDTEQRRWRRSDAGSQADTKRNASGVDRRKRKGDHDSGYGDDNDASFSRSRMTRKNPSPGFRGKFSAREGSRFKTLRSEEDDFRSARTSSSRSDRNRGGKGQSMLCKNSQASKWKKFDKYIRVKPPNGRNFDEQVAESRKLDDSGQMTEEKPRGRTTRVLDKTGKKLRVFKKDLVSDSEDIAPPKRESE